MRRVVILLAALLVASPAAANQAVGKTYLTNTRDMLFQVTSPMRLTFDRDDRMHMNDDGHGGDVSATVFYVQSSDEQALRDYFLPVAGKTSLIAGGLGSAAYIGNPVTLDVISDFFNVFTSNIYPSAVADFSNDTFQSNLAFNPKQKVVGIGLQWQQSFFDKYFFKASAPIVHVSNDLGMVETVTNAGFGTTITGAVTNMTNAFKQAALLYGKIDGVQKKWGVADVELILGRDWIDDPTAKMSLYAGLVCPTGNRPEAKYLWEAIIGNNKHWGAFFGSSSSYIWREGDRYVITALCDTDARYLFENTQVRMIDLKGRPWSRYMYLANTNAPLVLTTPNVSMFDLGLEFGANILTQAVRVAPHGSFTINSALNYKRDCGLEAEAGVNFFARQAENVKLANRFVNYNQYSVPALEEDINNANFADTVSFATINNAQEQSNIFDINHGSGSSQAYIFTESDLDLNSASTPAVLESTFYAALGKSWNGCRYPCFAGIGGSYTYTADNASIRRWGLWGKAGLTF